MPIEKGERRPSGARAMPALLECFQPLNNASGSDSVRVYQERPGTRDDALRAAAQLLVEHYVGIETVLKAGGFEKAAETIKNSLPTKKRIQSGDLGEVVAVEFLHAHTDFRAPILKLRYKSDRDTALHGNDLIALDRSGRRPTVLKGECKSRAHFSAAHLPDAVAPLDAHGGRPNPSTLSFITKRLYESGRDEEADLFRALQSTRALRLQDVEHLVFVLSGNDVTSVLAKVPAPVKSSIAKRWCAGLVVEKHGSFVDSVFTLAYGP